MIHEKERGGHRQRKRVNTPTPSVKPCTWLYGGGSMAEWLGQRTCNPAAAGSSPTLITKLELFLGTP